MTPLSIKMIQIILKLFNNFKYIIINQLTALDMYIRQTKALLR